MAIDNLNKRANCRPALPFACTAKLLIQTFRKVPISSVSIKGLYSLPQSQTASYQTPVKPDIKSGGGVDISQGTFPGFIPRSPQPSAPPRRPWVPEACLHNLAEQLCMAKSKQKVYCRCFRANLAKQISGKQENSRNEYKRLVIPLFWTL